MSECTMTLTERMTADGITMQAHFIGATHRDVPAENGRYSVGKVFPEWLCVLFFPEDTDFYMADPSATGHIDHFTSRRMIVEYGTGAMGDEGPVPPSAAEVLESLRSDASRMEEHEWKLSLWMAEYVAQGGCDKESVRKEVEAFDENVRMCRQLKEFLGDEYDDYVYNTAQDG